MTDSSITAPGPLRVLVVDPDDRIRESLARLLSIGGRCLCVGSAGMPDTALDLAASMSPDVVMLDSRLSELDAGQTLIARLHAAHPGIRVVVLNWSESTAPVAGLEGADAYIRKTFRPHELIDAVVTAARTPAA
jgi:DNA-binding NarL/FixJ family response regulator